MKTWSHVILVNLALTAVGLRVWLDPWPTTPEDESLSLVVGEVHHPNEIRQVSRPQWLVIPERGLYTGIAI